MDKLPGWCGKPKCYSQLKHYLLGGKLFLDQPPQTAGESILPGRFCVTWALCLQWTKTLDFIPPYTVIHYKMGKNRHSYRYRLLRLHCGWKSCTVWCQIHELFFMGGQNSPFSSWISSVKGVASPHSLPNKQIQLGVSSWSSNISWESVFLLICNLCNAPEAIRQWERSQLFIYSTTEKMWVLYNSVKESFQLSNLLFWLPFGILLGPSSFKNWKHVFYYALSPAPVMQWS